MMMSTVDPVMGHISSLSTSLGGFFLFDVTVYQDGLLFHRQSIADTIAGVASLDQQGTNSAIEATNGQRFAASPARSELLHQPHTLFVNIDQIGQVLVENRRIRGLRMIIERLDGPPIRATSKPRYNDYGQVLAVLRSALGTRLVEE